MRPRSRVHQNGRQLSVIKSPQIILYTYNIHNSDELMENAKLLIFSVLTSLSQKLYTLSSENSMINILNFIPKILPPHLLFIYSCFSFTLNIPPTLSSYIPTPCNCTKNLNTLLQSQLQCSSPITLVLIPKCLLFLLQNHFFCFCVCAHTTSCYITYSS